MDVLQRASPLDVSCLQQGAACISSSNKDYLSLQGIHHLVSFHCMKRTANIRLLYGLSAARGLAFVVSISPLYFKDELLMCIFIKVDH